eukprot:1751225-Rhodomonas_salina.1
MPVCRWHLALRRFATEGMSGTKARDAFVGSRLYASNLVAFHPRSVQNLCECWTSCRVVPGFTRSVPDILRREVVPGLHLGTKLGVPLQLPL